VTHEDRGHYAGKHPEGTPINPEIKKEMEVIVTDEKIACRDSQAIAEKLGVSMAEVGKTADLLEIRLAECQLGLYGYPEGGKRGKIVEKAESVSKEMEDALRGAMVEERLACKSCWDIAAQFGVKKIEVAAACETLDIKIKPCQLGGFERGRS